MKTRYEVIVGNIGTVYSGNNKHQALKDYNDYIWQSKMSSGRASGEDVTMLRDGEPIKEYFGSGINAEV